VKWLLGCHQLEQYTLENLNAFLHFSLDRKMVKVVLRDIFVRGEDKDTVKICVVVDPFAGEAVLSMP
jgi:hypothetical protein